MMISRFFHGSAAVVLAAGLVLGAGFTAHAQTAGQDMHNAGTDTKHAAKNTGAGVKTGTTKAYHSTKRGTKKAANKTKRTTVKGYDKTKQGTEHVVHPNNP